jgi:hypothetical protein
MTEKNSAPKPPEIPRLSDGDVKRIAAAVGAQIGWMVFWAALLFGMMRAMGWW